MGILKSVKKKKKPSLTVNQVATWFFGQEWRSVSLSTIPDRANAKAGKPIVTPSMKLPEALIAMEAYLIESGKYIEARKL